MHGITRRIVIAIGLLAAVAAAPAEARSVIERHLATLDLCGALKARVGGVVLGVDRLKDVALHNIKIELTGDDVAVSFSGALSCRTAGNAVMRGNASAGIRGAAGLNLADCKVRSLSVDATSFGGTFGEVLRTAWAPVIKPKIEEKAKAGFERYCREFSGADGAGTAR